MALYIGLMSGTSLDGVDAVLADVTPDAVPRALAHVHLAMPEALCAELLALNRSGDDEMHRAALAANALMRLYAAAVKQVRAAGGVEAGQVEALGAHGQTLRHQPGRHDGTGYTIQLVNGALLAELTGIAVVCDFRSRDVAAGGQGAPLVPAFHAACFGQPGHAVALLNVGGIANVSLLGADGSVQGWDTGPGNLLMDAWMRAQRAMAYDRDGAWAASGLVDARLLERMLGEPFFALEPPKSTGRDLFDMAWLQAQLDDGVTRHPGDVMATLAELTATSAAAAIRRFNAERLWVCGGGAANQHLMRRLSANLAGLPVASTAQAGVPPDQVEALAFAWLAMRFQNAKAGNLPAVTGARGPRILGALYPA